MENFAAGATTLLFMEEDRETFELKNFPLVIVHNGQNHFAPTKPRSDAEAQLYHNQRIYRSAWLARAHLTRRVPDICMFSDDQRVAFHWLYDALTNALSAFRPSESMMPAFQDVPMPSMESLPPGPEQPDAWMQIPDYALDTHTVQRVIQGLPVHKGPYIPSACGPLRPASADDPTRAASNVPPKVHVFLLDALSTITHTFCLCLIDHLSSVDDLGTPRSCFAGSGYAAVFRYSFWRSTS